MIAPNTFSVGADPGMAPGLTFGDQPITAPLAPPSPYENDARLLALFDQLKRESMENRWVWEREWLRDLYYVGNRQWITYHPTKREWVDKRLAKWVPKPVTNKMAETVEAVRTTLAAINLAVKVRPVGNDPQAVAAAEISDQMAPLIHEEHLMQQVMREADFWLITTGNACLQISWDKDQRFNKTFIPNDRCLACGLVSTPQDIVAANHTCPSCGSPELERAVGPDGKPEGEYIAFGRGKTTALSPFEYAFPQSITRFDELPYIIRLRWRDKAYYETNHPDIVHRLIFEKSPADRSLQIYKSLAVTNDIGTGSQFAYLGAGGTNQTEGITEYELWLRPTSEFPDGLVLRVAGEKSPFILRSPNEALPGPLPYRDIEGNPIFPFLHAQYSHMGGRLYGRGALAPLIQKQDQINQLDSLIQLCLQRTANPVWIIPADAGIDNLTGEPGLIVKWNVLSANGQGKPERVEGADIPRTLFMLREQYIKDIEELSGAFDIIKGQKPTGIEAFSALQLLVERSQSRFTSVFQARAEMYRHWFQIALELERQFGPQERTWAIVGPNRGYTFRHFENAQLQGQVAVQIEDGSNIPKTALGKRAAIEQANQLQLLNPADPDQRYALLNQFGLTDLVPALDYHVQAAQKLQDEFQRWAEQPIGPPPLVVEAWHDVQIHLNERVKWLNGDRMQELLAMNPALKPLLTMHIQELQMYLMPPPIEGGNENGKDGGSKQTSRGQATTNSNQNSAAIASLPSGNATMGPNAGPV